MRTLSAVKRIEAAGARDQAPRLTTTALVMMSAIYSVAGIITIMTPAAVAARATTAVAMVVETVVAAAVATSVGTRNAGCDTRRSLSRDCYPAETFRPRRVCAACRLSP